MAKSPLPTDVAVGARMRIRRKELGLSQSAVAEKLGITFQQIQKYEKGTNRVGASRLEAVAKALDVPITFFFDAAEHPSSISGVQQLVQPGAQELLAAFSRITDPSLRKAVVTLARNLATAGPLPEEEHNSSGTALNR